MLESFHFGYFDVLSNNHWLVVLFSHQMLPFHRASRLLSREIHLGLSHMASIFFAPLRFLQPSVGGYMDSLSPSIGVCAYISETLANVGNSPNWYEVDVCLWDRRWNHFVMSVSMFLCVCVYLHNFIIYEVHMHIHTPAHKHTSALRSPVYKYSGLTAAAHIPSSDSHSFILYFERV